MAESQEKNRPTDSVVVPERLPLDANITDQPPFTWAWDNVTIPPGFFIDSASEEGKATFLLVACCLGARTLSSRSLQTTKGASCFINPEYERRDVVEIAEKLVEYLEANHPSSIEYLKRYVGYKPGRAHEFNWDGMRLSQRLSAGEVLSYVGYAALKKRLDRRTKLAGLGQILDGIGISGEGQVRDAMPAKPSVNRRFRLFKSGALK